VKPAQTEAGDDRGMNEKRIHELEQKLAAIQSLVNAQAEDETLWFVATHITEAVLQEALRELHSVIEQ